MNSVPKHEKRQDLTGTRGTRQLGNAETETVRTNRFQHGEWEDCDDCCRTVEFLGQQRTEQRHVSRILGLLVSSATSSRHRRRYSGRRVYHLLVRVKHGGKVQREESGENREGCSLDEVDHNFACEESEADVRSKAE
jgi:hypothetical protein